MKFNLKIKLTIFCILTPLIFSEEILWKQKLVIKDFSDNYKGWVEVIISSCTFQDNEEIVYKTEVFSDTKLPFWFFAGESKTIETEFFDKDFLPLRSDFEIKSKKEILKIRTVREKDNIIINIDTSKKKKEKTLKFRNEILTPGNLRHKVVSLNLYEKKKYNFYLLDKVHLEYKKVTISPEGETIFNNIPVIKINVDVYVIGKFTFYIDKNYNIVYGEGMGIKVVPE